MHFVDCDSSSNRSASGLYFREFVLVMNSGLGCIPSASFSLWCLMNPQELFRAGRLADASKALSAELCDNPTDVRRRTFLFELLCFAGEYDRADNQLDVLA